MRRKRKAGKDKILYSFSLRDVYEDYKFDFDKETQLSKRDFLSVVDSLVDKLADSIIKERQFFKLAGGKGKFMMVKHKPDPNRFKNRFIKSNYLLTSGWEFFIYWSKKGKEAVRFPNKNIYVIKVNRKIKERVRNHVVDLANDPYQKDYNTILKP